MVRMGKLSRAKRVCEILSNRGIWLTTKSLCFEMGIIPGAGNTMRLNKMLHAMTAVGNVLRAGRGKFRWRIVSNYNRENPFAPPGSDAPPPKDDHDDFESHEEGHHEVKSKFDNPKCARCKSPIHIGSPIETWIHPVSGKKRWVHVGCDYNEHESDKILTGPLPTESEKPHEGNGHDHGGIIEVLKGKVSILESRVSLMDGEMEKLRAVQKKEIVLKIPNRKDIVLKEHVHPIFEQVMFHLHCGDNVELIGPRGSGKTFLAEQMARVLNREFGFISLSGGITEAKLFGRVTPNIQTGANEYHITPFVELYEEGGLFLLDERDAADPNVLLSLNGALANGVLALDRPKRPIARRHKEFLCMAASNTWGNGADRQYVGRNQQDTAFTERFVQIPMDYDADLELSLCPGKEDWVRKLHAFRKNIGMAKLERTLSTRFICRAYNWLQHGKDESYVEEMLFAGWRADEVKKARGY